MGHPVLLCNSNNKHFSHYKIRETTLQGVQYKIITSMELNQHKIQFFIIILYGTPCIISRFVINSRARAIIFSQFFRQVEKNDKEWRSNDVE